MAAEAASKIDDLIRHDNYDEEIEDVDDIDAIVGVAIVSISNDIKTHTHHLPQNKKKQSL